MIELWLVCIIGFLGLLSTILSSKGNLFDNRYKWHKKLTKRGRIVSLFGFLIIVLSVWQYILIDKKEQKKETDQIRIRKTSDSTISSEIKKGVEINRRNLFEDLSAAFAKQYFLIDTLSKEVRNIRDSAKTVIINQPKEIPILLIQQGGISHNQHGDTLDIMINLVSKQAAAYMNYINCFFEINFKNGDQPKTDIAKFKGPILMPRDQELRRTVSWNDIKNVDRIFIALIGSFSTDDKKIDFPLKDLYMYELSKNETSFFTAEAKQSFFSKYNLK